MTPAPRATRTPLSRERVLKTAVELADEAGIAALTMRKLAASLGVEAMSLYHHVANKDDILDGILDFVAAEIDTSRGDDLDWKAVTWRRAMSAQRVLMSHPWAGMLWVSRLNVGPARMKYMDTALRTYRLAGLSEDLAHRAFHVVENHVVGYTMQQLNFAVDMDNLEELGRTFLRDLPADEFPDLAVHVRQHVEEAPDTSGETEFEFGLRLILDGIERLDQAE